MKKGLLLSAIASTMIMAGGDIALAPVVEEESNWGEIFGQSRTFYVDRTYMGIKNENRNSLATGGYIGYKTPDFSGFTAAVAVYGTFNLGIHDITPLQDAGTWTKYDPSLYGLDGENYAFIGQAYLNYAFGNTNIKAGRQRLDTPLAGADDARMLPNLFEAVVVSNKDIENTTLIAAHVFRETVGTFGNIYGGGMLGVTSGYGLGMRQALSGEFVNMGTVALGNDINGNPNETDGVTALAAVYTGIDGLKLQAWDYIAWDILNAIYLQADYKYQVSDNFNLLFAGQYINEKNIGDALLGSAVVKDKNGNDISVGNGNINSNYWAVKAGLAYGDFSAYAAYSQTLDNDTDALAGDIITPWGGMPAFTQGMVTRHQFLAGTDSWKVAASYNLKEYGLKAVVYHAEFDVGDKASYTPGTKSTESGWDVTYKISAVDGLSLRARANYPRDFKEGLDWDEYRLIVNYNF